MMKSKKDNNEETVEYFREELKYKGHSLIWWHRNHIKKMYKYNYFIRQINLPESMRPDLLEAIVKYISE